MAQNSVEKTDELTLYLHNYAFYPQKVILYLHEKKVDFKPHVVDIMKDENYKPWYLEINPRGEVPVLKHGEKIIVDSAKIIDYVEEHFTDESHPSLVPEDPAEKEAMLEFRKSIDAISANPLTYGTLFHPDLARNQKLPFIAPVRSSMKAGYEKVGEKLKKVAEDNPTHKEVLLEKAESYEKTKALISNKESYLELLGEVDQALSKIEEHLASKSDGESWLVSKKFTIADVALTILLERLDKVGLSHRFWEGGVKPHISDYFKRAQKRESYQKTIPGLFFHFKTFLGFKVLMALHEKGARFKIESVNIAAGEQYRPDFLALNPKGEVPVLRDGERVIPDSAKIIAYLEERSEAENWPRLIPTAETDSPEVVELHGELHEAIHSLPADVITIGSFYHQELVRRPKLPFLLPTRIHMKNITERVVDKLRRLSSELPTWKDALLTKAARLEGDLALMKDKAEFQKVLTRLDEVLDRAEQRLASPNRSPPRTTSKALANHFWSADHLLGTTALDISLILFLRVAWKL